MKFKDKAYAITIIAGVYLALSATDIAAVNKQFFPQVEVREEEEPDASEAEQEELDGVESEIAAEEDETEEEPDPGEEPDPEEEEEPDLDLVSEGTVVVRTEQELYAAVNSELITTIHLGADITLTSELTKDYTINPGKTFLIMDGTNPYAEHENDRNIIYTLTDRNSSSMERVLRQRTSGNLKSIVIQNMDIIGRNHYGIVCVDAPGVYMYYENIIYSGPQLTYNPDGSAHYYNCNITIVQNGVSAVGEVAEAPDIILEGSVTIDKSVTGVDEIFYLRASTVTSASLKVEAGANVEITHNKTVNGGLIYSDQADYPVVIGKNAVLRFHGHHFVVENLAPACFEVEEGAQVYIDFVTLGYRAGLFTKNLVVGKEAVFHMEAGNSIGVYPLLMIREGGSAVFNDSLSVVLKIESSNAECVIMKGSGTNTTLTINCGQLNYWAAANGGGLTVLPSYHWQKASGRLTVQAGLNEMGTYTDIITNYDEAVDRSDLSWLNEDGLNSTTLNGRTGSILSMGRLDLSADFTDRPSASVRGITGGSAYVQARPGADPGDILWGPVQADSDGSYVVPVDSVWGEGDVFMVLANQGYLYQQTAVVTTPPGYRLTYDGNGQTSGEPPEDGGRYEAGVYAVVQGRGNLEKEGYQFNGWSAEYDGMGELFKEGDQILMNEDRALYAVWQEEVTEIDFAFVKVDEVNHGTILEEVQFALMKCIYEQDELHVHSELAGEESENCWELFQHAVSSPDGEVVFTGLTKGDYQLVETAAPEGYELPVGQWRIRIDPAVEEPVKITAMGELLPPGFLLDEASGRLLLPNERRIRLPLTGGRSDWVVLLVFVVIFAGGICMAGKYKMSNR